MRKPRCVHYCVFYILLMDFSFSACAEIEIQCTHDISLYIFSKALRKDTQSLIHKDKECGVFSENRFLNKVSAFHTLHYVKHDILYRDISRVHSKTNEKLIMANNIWRSVETVFSIFYGLASSVMYMCKPKIQCALDISRYLCPNGPRKDAPTHTCKARNDLYIEQRNIKATSRPWVIWHRDTMDRNKNQRYEILSL